MADALEEEEEEDVVEMAAAAGTLIAVEEGTVDDVVATIVEDEPTAVVAVVAVIEAEEDSRPTPSSSSASERPSPLECCITIGSSKVTLSRPGESKSNVFESILRAIESFFTGCECVECVESVTVCEGIGTVPPRGAGWNAPIWRTPAAPTQHPPPEESGRHSQRARSDSRQLQPQVRARAGIREREREREREQERERERESSMPMEHISPEGLRADGRRANELRRVQCRVGLFGRADGSAYFALGNTKVLAAVYGPRPLSQSRVRDGKHDRALIRCEYSMAAFSTGERKSHTKNRFVLRSGVFPGGALCVCVCVCGCGCECESESLCESE
jgi:3' exoribonuclease family, domain 1